MLSKSSYLTLLVLKISQKFAKKLIELCQFKGEKGVEMPLRIFTWRKPFMGMAKEDEANWVGCHMILVLESLPCMHWA